MVLTQGNGLGGCAFQLLSAGAAGNLGDPSGTIIIGSRFNGDVGNGARTVRRGNLCSLVRGDL